MTKSKKLVIGVIAIVSIVAALLAGGATIAFLTTETPAIDNSFTPVFVSCEVEESFTGATKSDVRVKNTSDIEAYVRATFVIMWIGEDGSVFSEAPVSGIDYSIELGSPSWNLGSDGFYYYAPKLQPGDSSEILIENLSILKEPPEEGYKLSVHVAATAIQAEPAAAVEEAWGATVHTNGSIFAP